MHTLLISAAELQALLASPAPVLVLDCSFDLSNPAAGRALFEAEHLPGAAFMDLDQDLSEKAARPAKAATPCPRGIASPRCWRNAA